MSEVPPGPGPVHVNDIAPTPERGWLWRRLYAFTASAALLWLLRDVIVRTKDSAALQRESLQLIVVLISAES